MALANAVAVRGRFPILHRLTLELRYLNGYTFLDRSGRIINAIMHSSDEWILRDPVSPQNAPLSSLVNMCTFSFSSVKMDFDLQQPLDSQIESKHVNMFKSQIDDVSRIVIDQLGLDQFSRIGLRAWYVFRCESKEESEQWLAGLGLSRSRTN